MESLFVHWLNGYFVEPAVFGLSPVSQQIEQPVFFMRLGTVPRALGEQYFHDAVISADALTAAYDLRA